MGHRLGADVDFVEPKVHPVGIEWGWERPLSASKAFFFQAVVVETIGVTSDLCGAVAWVS